MYAKRALCIYCIYYWGGGGFFSFGEFINTFYYF